MRYDVSSMNKSLMVKGHRPHLAVKMDGRVPAEVGELFHAKGPIVGLIMRSETDTRDRVSEIMAKGEMRRRQTWRARRMWAAASFRRHLEANVEVGSLVRVMLYL